MGVAWPHPQHVAVSLPQCYMFHMYVGVRAGGGIGDEIEDPAGDEYEIYRIIFDITFFFFVIVILLAIIQGNGSSQAPEELESEPHSVPNHKGRVRMSGAFWESQMKLFLQNLSLDICRGRNRSVGSLGARGEVGPLMPTALQLQRGAGEPLRGLPDRNYNSV